MHQCMFKPKTPSTPSTAQQADATPMDAVPEVADDDVETNSDTQSESLMSHISIGEGLTFQHVIGMFCKKFFND